MYKPTSSRDQADRLRARFSRVAPRRGLSRFGRWAARPASSDSKNKKTPAALTNKVLFEPLEPRLLFSADLMPLVVDMADVGSDVTLLLNSTAGTIEVYDTVNPASGPLVSQKLNETSEIVIKGVDNRNDTLTVDFTAPFFKDITFQGGAGAFDSLVINGGQFDSSTYIATGPDAGTIDLQDDASNARITYSGLEPITDNTATVDRTFAVPASGQQIRMTDGSAAGRTLIDSNGTGGFESIDFINPTGSLTINALGGNNTFILGSYSFNKPLTLNGAGGTDTIQATRNESMTLSNSSLSFNTSGQTVTLSSIEKASLTGGSLNNTLDASAFTGATTLNGGGTSGGIDRLKGGTGDTTYIFGNNWGNVEITEAGGDDTLNFGPFTGALTLNSGQIVDSANANNKVTGPANTAVANVEHIVNANFVMSASDVNAFKTGVDQLVTWGTNLAKFDLLDQHLPMVNQVTPGGEVLPVTVGSALNLGDTFDRLRDVIQAYFTSDAASPTTRELIDYINSHPLVLTTAFPPAPHELALGNFTTLTAVATPRYVINGSGTPELVIDIDLNAERTTPFNMALGNEADELGLDFGATTLPLKATLDATLGLGLTPGGAFFLDTTSTVNVGAEIHQDNLNNAFNFGFLTAHLQNGSIDLDARADVSLTSRLTTAQLGQQPGTVPAIQVAEGLNVLDVNLPVDVDSDGLDAATQAGFENKDLVLDLDDVFSEDAPSVEVQEDGVAVPDSELLAFSNLNAVTVLPMLVQLANTLTELSQSELMDFEIPFAGGRSLGDLLNFAEVFKEMILDPLYISGDANDADGNNDNKFDGQDLTFHSIQELAAILGDSLAAHFLPDFEVHYDPGTQELTFPITFEMALFAAAVAATTTNGDPDTNTSEVQTLTVTKGAGSVFTLSFGGVDVDGASAPADVTGNIAVGASAADVAAALKALANIGDNDVSVVLTTDDATHSVYTVTFTGDLANKNVEQLAPNALPVDFSLDLGDLASIESHSTLGLNASLALNLIFGISLDPSQEIVVAPTGNTPALPANGILSGPAHFEVSLFNINDNGLSDPDDDTSTLVTSFSVTVNPDGTNTSVEDLRKDVQAAIDAQLVSQGRSLGFSSLGLTNGSTVTAAGNSLLEPDANIPITLTLSDSNPSTKDIKGSSQVQQSHLLDNTSLSDVRDELQAAINKALQSINENRAAGQQISVTVGTSGGKLTFTTSGVGAGETLSLYAQPAVVATTGGGRISLVASPAYMLPDGAGEFDSAELVKRRLEIQIDSPNDPALAQLGLLSSPTRYDGVLTQNASFTLVVNGIDVPVTVNKSVTTANQNLDDLVQDIQDAIDTALEANGFDEGDVVAHVVSAGGNIIGYKGGESGVVDRLAIKVADRSPANGAMVDLGLGSIVDQNTGVGGTARSMASSFFFDALDDKPTLSADLTIDLSDIDATASFGFLSVNAASSADSKITAHGGFNLVNPDDHGRRVTVTEIIDAIADGNFTDLIDGEIGGAIKVDLELTPDLGFGDLPGVTLSVDLDIPNWLDEENRPVIDSSLVTITGPGLDAFDNFTEFNLQNVIDGLQLIVDMLRSLDGTDPTASAVASALETPLPFINRSVTDLVSMADKFAEFLEQLEQDPSGSVQLLEGQLRTLLGLPPIDDDHPAVLSLIDFNEDGATPTLRFDFSFIASAESSLPLALDFEGLDGFAGIETDGNLLLDVTAGLNLAFGLALTGTASDPGFDFFLFTGDGDDEDDEADTRLFVEASATGSDLEFSATFGPVGVFVTDGTASLTAGIGVTLDGGGDDRFDLTSLDDFSADNISVDVSGSANVDLPLSIGTKDAPIPLNGSLTVAIEDLPAFISELIDGNITVGIDGSDPDATVLITTPDFDFELPSLEDLIRNPAQLVGGLDSFLGALEDALNGQLFGIDLPFVGDQLSGAADFISDIRHDLLQPLANLLRNTPDPLDLLKGFLFDIFHNDLDILLDSTGDSAITVDDIKLILGDDNSFIQFDFLIGQHIDLATADIDFDLGIPGLGLDVNADLDATLDWSLNFGFGISREEGFYFLTQRTDEEGNVIADDPDNPDPEVEVKLQVTLGDAASITGQLGFLALKITDGLDTNGDNVIDDEEKTRLFVELTIDLKDPGEDGHLTFAELRATSLSEIFDPKVEGGAIVRAAATVDFSTVIDATVLPAISTNIFVDWSIIASPEGIEFGSPDVSLRDITLDLGSFISDFAGPILEELGDIIKPLGFLVDPEDGLLFMRLPLLSDLAGQTITLVDLAEMLSPNTKVRDFVNAISEVYSLIDLVTQAADDADGGNILLHFGSLVLSGSADGIDDQFGLINLNLGDLRQRPNLKGVALPTLPDTVDLPVDTPASSSEFSKKVTRGEGSLDIGLFKPANIMKLLMGQDVDLVTYDVPALSFDFTYTQRFPLFGPLIATLSGKFSAGLDLAIGYDTVGLSEFRATGNPANLLNGFFFSDVDLQTQQEVVEAFIKGSIAAGAELNLGVARGGVEGGIGATINFDFNDPNQDGKIRGGEMALNVLANDFNPLAVFDVHGAINFFLHAFVEVNLLFFKFSHDETIVDIELFNFDIPFDRPANLASKSGDTLIINAGPNSAGRYQGNLDDIAENISVRSNGSAIEVYSNDSQYHVSSSLPLTFTGIKKIVVFGGSGDDVFDFSEMALSDVTIEAHGGDGNDTIIGGGGLDQIFGDAGDDILRGGGGDDEISGGFGNDLIHGDGGNDHLLGEDGVDTLFGDAGTDNVLDGGAGNDELHNAPGSTNTFGFAPGGGSDTIFGDPSSFNTLQLPETGEPATFILKNGKVIAGLGAGVDTDADGVPDLFAIQVTGDLAVIDAIVGSNQQDTFHVFDGAVGAGTIVLDGAKGNDRYILHGEDGAPGASANVTVQDTGETWEQDAITVVGNNGANGAADDKITLTNGSVGFNFGAIALTMNYVPPVAEEDPLLLIEVLADSGDDTIRVESTAATVPVRINTGAGDDTVVVGDSEGGLDGILGTRLDGAGLGPLVLIGGAGHDAVIFDDSADTSNNFGNLTAFRETREGVEGTVEVGVLSGLDMKLDLQIDEDHNGSSELIEQHDGRIEFEGFEVADVRLGHGSDTFTIGGGFNVGLAIDDPARGTAEDRQLVDTTLPPTRLIVGPNELGVTEQKFGVTEIVHSITGLTTVSGGDEANGGDTINVIATSNLDTTTFDRDDLNNQLSLLTTNTRTEGGAGVNEVQRLTIAPAALKASSAFGDGVGYFTLQFGYQETKPLAFDATAADILNALTNLSLIGRNAAGLPNVSVSAVSSGVFDITFVRDLQKQNQANQIQARVVPLTILGGAGADHLNVQSVDETTFFLGGDGNDFVQLNVDVSQVSIANPALPNPPVAMTTNGVNAVITLDGEADGDKYSIHLIGHTAASLINVFDSGGIDPPNDPLDDQLDDELTVFGVDEATTAGNPDAGDLFLLRAGAGEKALAFIALLNDGAPQPFERVNYNTNLEKITVEGQAGDDQFYIDDTRAKITINGGDGNDFFQIGQLYKTQRTVALAGVAPEDVYATTETTRGFLSNGISLPMTINGDAGEDNFIVFRNLAVLTLNGGDDNDTFLVQAFALVGSVDDQRARTDLTGDGGADLIQYAVNAPVRINGGDGFDTVIIIGTEFSDDFVVTKDGVFGGGLNVNFINVEYLEVDGAEGDDRFFILSTGPNMATKVVGGLGNDTFNVQGPTPENGVISNDLHGHSGIITESVESNIVSSTFQGLNIDGISANVADNDEPAVVITPSDGFSNAFLGSIDEYTVVLSRLPLVGLVRVSVSPPKGLVLLREDENNPGNFIEVRNPADNTATGFKLEFDATNWFIPQTIKFKLDSNYINDPSFVFPDVADIEHEIEADDTIVGVADAGAKNGNFVAESPGQPTKLEAKLVDLDASFPTSGTNNLPQGLRGSYVTTTGDSKAAGQTRMILDVQDAHTLILDRAWDIIPTAGTQYEIRQFSGVLVDNVRVEVNGPDRPQIVVEQLDGDGGVQSGGFTSVAEGAGAAGDDFIQVRLSQALAPGDTVTVDLMSTLVGGTAAGSAGQLRFFNELGTQITSLTFNATNFDDFQKVRVQAFDDGLVEGFHKADLVLGASGGAYNGVSRTIVASIADNDAPGVRIIESDGSTNVIEFDPALAPPGAPAAAGFPMIDTYQVVLTQAPKTAAQTGTVDEVITVHIDPRETRTSRTGGIVNFADQVEVSLDGVNFFSSIDLQFTHANWDDPQTVYVRAKDDAVVDGQDTQVFAPQINQVNNIQGPLILIGGEGADRTGLLEREPIMLPGEINLKASLGNVVGATEATLNSPATITIDPTQAGADLLALLGVSNVGDITAEHLIDKTIEITDGPGKNKIRIITDAEIVDAHTIVLTINKKWESPFNNDLSVPNSASTYTLYATNANFLVNETESVDYLVVDDTDNINSFDDPASPSGSNPFGEGHMFFDDVNRFGNSDEGLPPILNMYRITGFGMGGDRLIGAGSSRPELQPGGISYDQLETVEVNLGEGNNKLTVDDTNKRADGFQTWTLINTGGGNDVVTLNLDPTHDGRIAVDAGAGDDNIDGASSSLPLVIFGGAGEDKIASGSGDDIIFGDRGQVDFLDNDGAIVTRLGATPDLIEGSLTRTSTGQNLADSNAPFLVADPLKVADRGLAGLYVTITDGPGVGQQRLITGNTQTQLFLSEAWDTGPGTGGMPNINSKYLILTTPEFQTDGIVRDPSFARTIDPDVGGADIITDVAGRDMIFGGAGDDKLTDNGGGVGLDILVGDQGEAAFDPIAQHANVIRTTDPSKGGDDQIVSSTGANAIFGGMGADTIVGGNASDIILGDNGRALFSAAGQITLIETTDEKYGKNDTITGSNGADVIMGGSDSDTILSGTGDTGRDVILGDSGFAQFAPGLVLTHIETRSFINDGNDHITSGGGSDVVLGGTGKDVILGATLGGQAQLNSVLALINAGDFDAIDPGDDAADILVGDNGLANFSNGTLVNIQTSIVDKGGIDIIVGGNGPDVVFGGSAGDTIVVGGDDDAADTVLGDNGRATFGGTETLGTGEAHGILSFNFNASTEGTIVTGPAGTSASPLTSGLPAPRAGNWNNIAGDGLQTYGDQAGETVIFDDGTIAPGVTVKVSNLGAVDLGRDNPILTTDTHDQIGTATTDDARMFAGYLTTGTAFALGVEITGLASHFQTYDLYIYLDGDDANSASGTSVRSITNGTATYYLNDADGHTFTGVYQRVTAQNPNLPGIGNYVVFEGMTGNVASIRIDDSSPGSDNRPVLAGIQVVGRSNPIDRLESKDPDYSGLDTIITGGGPDIVIGGGGIDVINTAGAAVGGKLDADVVAGDNARATFMFGQLREIHTTSPDVGGNDIIRTGNGEDIVLGGFGADDLRTRVEGTFDNGDVQVISVNFSSGNAKGTVTGVAGAVQAEHWNNLVTAGTAPSVASNLLFDDGALAQGVSVKVGADLDSPVPQGRDVNGFTAATKDTHDELSNPDTQNERIFEGYLYTDSSRTLGVNVSGLSEHFQTYDVYVYIDGDNSLGNSVSRITDGRTAYYLNDAQGNTFTGEFVQADSTNRFAPGTGNYVVFRGLTGDAVSLRIDDDTTLGAGGRPSITAIQIVGGADKNTLTVGGDYDADAVVGDNGSARLFQGVLYDLRTTDATVAGDDRVLAGDGRDVVLGGSGKDNIDGGAGHDVLLGDNGRVIYFGGEVVVPAVGDFNFDPLKLPGITLLNTNVGGDDTLIGGVDDDLMYGQFGNDTYKFIGSGLGTDMLAEAGNGINKPNDLHDLLDFSAFTKPLNNLDLSVAGLQTVNGAAVASGVNLKLVLFSGTAIEDVIGSAYNDTILGNDRANTLLGRAGNDLIRGIKGNDDIDGGDGTDSLYGDDGNDVMFGGTGNDAMWAGSGNDAMDGEAGDDALYGESGDDILLGGEGNDSIWGGTGNDGIDGGAGNDTLFGEDGNDTIRGAAGIDVIWAGRGNDLADGGADDDVMHGEDGNDILLGAAGNDTMLGEAGNDLIDGESGNDNITGGQGSDILLGGSGDDRIDATDGGRDGIAERDVIEGGTGADTIFSDHLDSVQQEVAPGQLGLRNIFAQQYPSTPVVDPIGGSTTLEDRDPRRWLQGVLTVDWSSNFSRFTFR